MDTETLRLVIIAVSIWSYKVAALVVGYLFTYLGYKLLLKGISGAFKFSAGYKGVTADVISASPGIFFTLAGTIIIAFALYKGFALETAPVECLPGPTKQESPATGRTPGAGLPRIPPEGTASPQ